MRIIRGLVAVAVVGVLVCAAVPGTAQEVAKRRAKRAAKEATESAAKQKAEDVAKGAAKKAMAPDAVDLNSAPPEVLAKLGLDEATAKKVVEGRPYASLEDPKLTEAIPSETLSKLQGKVTVKAAEAPASDSPAASPTPATPPVPETPPTM
jgi:DNA uptake protein ComE-like DNA-binding protein